MSTSENNTKPNVKTSATSSAATAAKIKTAKFRKTSKLKQGGLKLLLADIIGLGSALIIFVIPFLFILVNSLKDRAWGKQDVSCYARDIRMGQLP